MSQQNCWGSTLWFVLALSLTHSLNLVMVVWLVVVGGGLVMQIKWLL